MNYLDALYMLMRWKKDGWEVHPLIDTEEFRGWL